MNRRNKLSMLIFGLLLITYHAAKAEDAAQNLPQQKVAENDSPKKDSEENFIRFFVGMCVQSLPDLERIKSAARVLHWKPLQNDWAAMLAPSDKTADWQGWFAIDEGNPFLVGISKGKAEGKTISSCSVSVRETNQNHLVSQLQEAVTLNPIANEVEALQRYRTWETPVNDQPMMINLTTYSGVGDYSATLSAAIIQQAAGNSGHQEKQDRIKTDGKQDGAAEFPIGFLKGTGFMVEKDGQELTEKDMHAYSSSVTIVKQSDGLFQFTLVANLQRSPSTPAKSDKRVDVFRVVWESPTTGKLLNSNSAYEDDKSSFTVGNGQLVIKSWIARNQLWETHTYSLSK